MARRTIQLPTTQEIERLYKSGDISQLREINERLAKTANQRMSQLFESKMNTPALDRAQYYLYQESEVATGGVFSRSKKIEVENLVDQIKEELIFLRSSTSTVSGTKEIRTNKIFKTLTEGKVDAETGTSSQPILEIPEDVKPPDTWQGTEEEYFKNTFMKFLASDAWKDVKKFLYVAGDSTLFRQAGESIAAGASLKELRTAYKQYLKKEISIYTMWDKFTSIK